MDQELRKAFLESVEKWSDEERKVAVLMLKEGPETLIDNIEAIIPALATQLTLKKAGHVGFSPRRDAVELVDALRDLFKNDLLA